MKMKFTPVFTLSMLFAMGAYAQTDSTASNIEDLSLEDLMNVKVVSASKKAESAFDAPLSIGSVSRDEIKRAGSTSIMEALRLIPGLLVTETSNGNYDVQIRGFNGLPLNSPLNSATNSISLVMIDNRPVYNYFNGGTFWETLPIDLNDVERIEVVRGPASALYGPNAAAGVINIITRKLTKEGFYAVANVQGGLPTKQVIPNASVGFRAGKLDVIVSGNYQYRERTETDYYSWVKDKKVSADSMTVAFPTPRSGLKNVNGASNVDERYPNPNVATNKGGYNAFINYNISEKSMISLNLGGQKSQVQKAFIENLATPYSTSESTTNYADLKAKINNFSGQVSYLGGTQDASRGFTGYKYDFNTLDATAEYDINIKGFSIKPGLNYRNATYNDSKYIDVTKNQGFLNGPKSLSNIAGSLRGEYNFKDKLKLIAAGRVDKYNAPDKAYLSYQFAATYKLNENNLIRATYSKAYRGPNMYDFYNSQSLFIYNQTIGVDPQGNPVALPVYAGITGNDNLNLLGISMLELGYRVKATEKLHFDLDLFYQTANNFTFLTDKGLTYPDLTNLNANSKFIQTQSIQNIAMKANQYGATLSANYVAGKFQFKPFVTIQQTQLTSIPLYRSSVATDTNNIYKTYDAKHDGTPSVYGGAYVNYQLGNKWNINLNGYFYSNYTYSNIFNAIKNSSTDPANGGIVNVSGKLILNLKVSYRIIKPLDVFINVRNLTNSSSYEFAQTDITKATFLVGGSFEF